MELGERAVAVLSRTQRANDTTTVYVGSAHSVVRFPKPK